MVQSMRSVVKCIYGHSLNSPEKTAVIATDCTVSYKTFWQYILGVNQLLKERGIKRGDRIILEASHTVGYMTCIFAAHLQGAACVLIENGTPADRVQEIAQIMRPTLVITGKRPLEVLGVTDLEMLADITNSGVEFPDENLLQEILFTTGTTGSSKGVMITHFALMNMCESEMKVLKLRKDNVWLIPTPLNHAAGIRRTYMSMVNGSTVVLMDGFMNLKLFFENMRYYNVTSVYLPPSAVHYILLLASKELAKFDEQLDFLFTSSSVFPSEEKQRLIRLLPHVRLFEAYGSSEVGAVVYFHYNAVQAPPGCVGKPNPGINIFTVDENLQPMHGTKENPGIIAIKSKTIMSGYWNEPELTAQTIRDGVIYMSDLGYLDEDGYLYLVGRRDDVINLGGLKVAPTEVEDVALHLPEISECICVPFGNKVTGLSIKMYVVLKDGYAFDAERITDYLKTKLEAYKIPRFIETIDEIPKTFNGKIDRKKLIG